jgi:hypothetical protein
MRHAKLRLLKTMIRPVVMCGSKSWNIISTDTNRIGVIERKIKINAIFGPKKEGDIYNIELTKASSALCHIFRLFMSCIMWNRNI